MTTSTVAVEWTEIRVDLTWDECDLQETLDSISRGVAQLQRGEGREFTDKDLPVDDD